MKNIIIGIIVVVVVIAGLAYLMKKAPATPTNNDTSSSTSTDNNQNPNFQGRVVFSVTDAAADMSAISEINMKVNSVDVHSSGTGWATVSTTPRTYSLLALKAQNKSELLADINANAGIYDQIRLNVDSIAVKTKAGATKEAKLPSGELKINTNLVVKAGTTSSVNFDFLADKSLHTTGNGEYIFAPVVKTETKSDADVSIDAASAVTISGGKVDKSETVGMDVDGSVKVNFEIKGSQKLNIGSDNLIKIGL